MVIIKAEEKQIEKIVEMSIRAFETDVNVGGAKGDCPPGFDSVEWHQQMAREGHLYLAMIENDLVGAAVIFPDETKNSVYIGRIFIDPVHYRKGYGISLMKLVEAFYPGVKKIKLDTPLWNVRTNAFYTKLGYCEVRRDDEFAYYQKELN
jgi:RimJ/RimL family protein N-acetyltransferase